jgi:ligand-binding SRPBCC domain-containing protein
MSTDYTAEAIRPIAFRSAPGVQVLETDQWVGAGLEETFAFFSDATNLGAITPPYLGFRILTPLPIEMRDGALIEYRLTMMGLPMNWLTRIEQWAPNHSFVDVQLRGPYARWVHRHTFVSEAGGTRVRDRIEYAIPFAPLSDPVLALFVRPTLGRIFRHRHETIARLLK